MIRWITFDRMMPPKDTYVLVTDGRGFRIATVSANTYEQLSEKKVVLYIDNEDYDCRGSLLSHWCYLSSIYLPDESVPLNG